MLIDKNKEETIRNIGLNAAVLKPFKESSPK